MIYPMIRIAASGHRHLTDLDCLESGIVAAVAKILAVCPAQVYQVYSCLAEGADRFLARRLVSALPADLIVVLPLPEPEYLKDFRNNGSLDEYRSLRQLARTVLLPDHNLPRPEAYHAANQTLLLNCDLLVVIWNGAPARGPGGTGEVVRLFRQAGRPLLWIHAGQQPLTGHLIEERLENLSLSLRDRVAVTTSTNKAS